MKSWPAKALLLAGAASLLAAIPALGQEQSPNPCCRPASTIRRPCRRPRKGDADAAHAAAANGAANRANPASPAAPGNAGEATDGNLIDLEEVALDQMLGPRPSNYFTVPAGQRTPGRPGRRCSSPGNFGLAPGAFGPDFGGRSAALMRALDAPLPSRWTSILLRRALLSRLDAPAGVNPVDFVAERASLLLRMGEADAARMLVQGVDVENYTPRMIEVAGQTALATADPSALCPLVGPARSRSNDVVWVLADGMCAALEGEAARATALIDQARNQAGTSIDLLLAEKVVGSGEQSRRGVEVEWNGVDRINPWRFGLASATGVEIPERLRNGMPPQITAWMARAPMVPLEQRLQAGAVAAELGVFSSNSLVELHSLMLDQLGEADSGGTVGARLRTAWAGRSVDERMTRDARALDGRRGAGRALCALDPDRRRCGADSGLERSLRRCRQPDRLDAERRHGPAGGALGRGGRAGRRWRSRLGLARGRRAAGRGRRSILAGSATFAGADDSPGQMRSQLLVAGLAGLGRISADQASPAGLRLGPERPLDPGDRPGGARAARPASVALLAGIGMQTARLDGRAAGISLPDRPCAARGRAGVRSADDRRRGRGAAVTDAQRGSAADRGLPRNDGRRGRRRAQHPACLRARPARRFRTARRRACRRPSPSRCKSLAEAWLPLKRATVARKAAALRRFFAFLQDEGMRADDPSAALPRPASERPLAQNPRSSGGRRAVRRDRAPQGGGRHCGAAARRA